MKEGYGASISTLRELLNRLSSEGLIVAEGLRGFEVTPVSAENFCELAAMRLLLECHALAQSFAAGDMEWEGRVVSGSPQARRDGKADAGRRPQRSRDSGNVTTANSIMR